MEPDSTETRPVLAAADLEKEIGTIEARLKVLDATFAKIKAEEMVLVKERLKAEGALAAFKTLLEKLK